MKLEKLGPVGPEELCCKGAQLVFSAANVLPPSERRNCNYDEFAEKLGWNLFEFGFERLFLVLRWPFALVGNHARGGRRNTGLTRRSPRFCSFVQNLLSFPHHLIAANSRQQEFKS